MKSRFLLATVLSASFVAPSIADAKRVQQKPEPSTSSQQVRAGKKAAKKRKAPVRPNKSSAEQRRSLQRTIAARLKQAPARDATSTRSRGNVMFGSTRQLVQRLLKDVKVKGTDANDPANGWWIPVDPNDSNSDYIGFVQEAEAKFQVAKGTDKVLSDAMAAGDFDALFGSELGSKFSELGMSIVKQASDRRSVEYSDVYFDDASLTATGAGISIRNRQIGDQIGTEKGMFEVKLYTDEGNNGAVADRIEIRKTTNERFTARDMLAQKPEVALYNPRTYLAKAVARKRDANLRGLADAELKPTMKVLDDRVEYNIRDKEGRSLYLGTLDYVTGEYAGEPRTNLDGEIIKSGDRRDHIEMEVEQMFNSADADFHGVLSELSGQQVTARNADKVAKEVLVEMTRSMERTVDGLTKSDRNKPGIAAQNFRLID